MKNENKWVPLDDASQHFELSRYKLLKLVAMDVLDGDQERVDLEQLEKVVEDGLRHEYVFGLKRIAPLTPGHVGLAVPLADPTYSPHLELSADNDLRSAHEAFAARGRQINPDQFVTGWWSFAYKRVEPLLKAPLPLLGVTAGFVREVAFVEDIAQVSDKEHQTTLLVTRASADERAAYLGRLQRINQTGLYVALP